MSLMRTFEIGSTGLVAQSIRLNTTASNIANAETLEGPDGRAYRGRQVVFRTTPIDGAPGSGVEVANIVENDAPCRCPGLYRDAQRESGGRDGEHDLGIALVSTEH
jgi:flagellar basal-body rod protein FlgC